MDMVTGTGSLRFQIGRWMIIVVAVLFLLAGVRGILTPMQGEEALAGSSYGELRTSQPGLADVIWHMNMAIWIIAMGIMVVVGLLAWRELPRRSRAAWYTIAGVGTTFLVSLLAAHIPMGHPGVAHWGPPTVLTLLLLVAVGLTATPAPPLAGPGHPRAEPEQMRGD